MNKKIIYDYVICGSGAAGLSLINELISDKYFLNHKILLLDKKKRLQTIEHGPFGRKEKENMMIF